MKGYKALVQVNYRETTEAFGVLETSKDFTSQEIANTFFRNYPTCLDVKIFDTRLDPIGIYYNDIEVLA